MLCRVPWKEPVDGKSERVQKAFCFLQFSKIKNYECRHQPGVNGLWRYIRVLNERVKKKNFCTRAYGMHYFYFFIVWTTVSYTQSGCVISLSKTTINGRPTIFYFLFYPRRSGIVVVGVSSRSSSIFRASRVRRRVAAADGDRTKTADE